MSATSDAHQPRHPQGRLADQGRTLSGWLNTREEQEEEGAAGSQAKARHGERQNNAGKRANRHGDTNMTRQSTQRPGSQPVAAGEKRSKPRLAGGNKAIIAFALSLVAFTIQTEAAQYVQQALGYRKPFLSLYIGHSAFTTLFPLYLLCLRFAEPGVPISHQLHLIALNLHWQLSTPTRDLPQPMPDSIRKRLSSLSMRKQQQIQRPRTLSRPLSYREASNDESIHAEDFDISSIEQHGRMTRTSPPLRTWSEKRLGFDIVRLLGVFGVLTVGITVPALSWYSAVPLTSMADITTIYNTYAIWALVFSIWFLGEEWERRKVFSVLMACGGVILVAYGGAEHRRRPREPVPPAIFSKAHDIVTLAIRFISKRADDTSPTDPAPAVPSSNALLGDMLAFFGAVTMAAYEMAFKVVATLPDEEAQSERFEGFRREHDYVRAHGGMDEGEGLLSDDEEEGQRPPSPPRVDRTSAPTLSVTDSERTAFWKPAVEGDASTNSPNYQSVSPAADEDDIDEAPLDDHIGDGNMREGMADNVVGHREARVKGKDSATHGKEQDWIPPPLPFGLQPIIMTSGIGIMTFTTLWIGIPIASAIGWEPFELPSNFATVFYLFVVAFTGIIFNGCFSILLALWGPVLASVSCLLTTVLVFFADLILGHDFHWISLLGCISIAAGFAVLVTGDRV